VTVQSERVRTSAPAGRRRGTSGAQARDRRPRGASHPTVASEPAASAPPRVEETPGPDRGDGMFLIFAAATLLMVVAVVAVTAVNQWWVLIPVMLLDFTITFGVIAAVVLLLKDDGRPRA
jgi:hypothetical protein